MDEVNGVVPDAESSRAGTSLTPMRRRFAMPPVGPGSKRSQARPTTTYCWLHLGWFPNTAARPGSTPPKEPGSGSDTESSPKT
jgi:hypothetical protein